MTADHEVRDLSNQSFLFNELHPEAVLNVDFSPDGDEVVACGQSGTVRVFNLRARGLRLTLTGHKEAANVARFSANAQVICSGSDDATVRLWHAETGEFLASSNRHELRVVDLAFVPGSNEVSLRRKRNAAYTAVLPQILGCSLHTCEG
jgi:WD40 repeat protein